MSSGDLPPYFNISPDAAFEALEPAMDTAGFAAIAQSCQQGRADLMGRGMSEEGSKTLRLFSTWEITKYLIPVAPAHFRRVLRANPELPQGRSESENGAKWFAFDEVLRLRAHFAAEGSRPRTTCPTAPKVSQPSWWRLPISKAVSARHLPARIWPCRPLWMATKS